MFRFFIIFFIYLKSLNATSISIAIPGLAKVGNACFLNMLLKNISKSSLNSFDIKIYLTNEKDFLLGDGEISLFKLNKNQTYNTSVPINLKENDKCRNIKNVKVFLKKCYFDKNTKVENCNSLLKVDNNKLNNKNLNVAILKNKNFYNSEKNNIFFISELDIYLKALDNNLVEKYKIRKEKSGMMIVKGKNNIFKEGDLILELEMVSINNINDVKKILKRVKNENKDSVIVNFIRDNKKKLIAAYLK